MYHEDHIRELTHPQLQIWFQSFFNEAFGAYKVYNISQVDGPVRTDRLQAALDTLVARHEPLRSEVVIVDGECKLYVNPQPPAGNPVAEAVVAADAPLEDAIRRLKEDLFATITGFEASPLFRLGLLRVAGTDRSYLVLCVHHLIFDRYSINLFVKELFELYQDRSLPALRVPYQDVLRLLEEKVAARLEASRTFWREHLADLPPRADLPLDYPRPEDKDFNGLNYVFNLGPERSEKVRKMAGAHRGTPFSLLFSAFNLLVARLTGSPDVTVGVPFDGRVPGVNEHTIGMYVNTLPIRTRVTDQPFDAFLAETTRALVRCRANQFYPLLQIVQDLDVSREVNRNPLYDILFVFQAEPAALHYEDLQVSKKHHFSNRANLFDLIVEVLPADPELIVKFAYDPHLFSRPTVEAMAEKYVGILDQVLSEAGIPTGRVDVRPAGKPLPGGAVYQH